MADRVHPPIDAEVDAALRAAGESLPSTITREDIPRLREIAAAAAPSDLELQRGDAIEIEERTVPGSNGRPPVAVLICRPSKADMLLPGVYAIHGGGMAWGDARSGMTLVLDWVEQFGMTAVSVEYRLAPEFPHPAPVEDCYAGLNWTAENAEQIGIDPDCLIVAGGSSGGGLAAAVTLMARDFRGPSLRGQILMYPMLDDRNLTPSSQELMGEGTWDRAANVMAWTALLGEARGGPAVPSYAAPSRETDLSQLPPAYLDVGSVDIFRDEVVDYAARMWRAGGAAELHVWAGGCHGFDLFAPQAAISQACKAARASWIQRLLSQAKAPRG
jgi:acetyl esterase/lipase